jgi:hypothetical protein
MYPATTNPAASLRRTLVLHISNLPIKISNQKIKITTAEVCDATTVAQSTTAGNKKN